MCSVECLTLAGVPARPPHPFVSSPTPRSFIVQSCSPFREGWFTCHFVACILVRVGQCWRQNLTMVPEFGRVHQQRQIERVSDGEFFEAGDMMRSCPMGERTREALAPRAAMGGRERKGKSVLPAVRDALKPSERQSPTHGQTHRSLTPRVLNLD